MPELLGVTNATPAHDSALNNRNLPSQPNSLPIQNVVDPSRVGRGDARTDREDTAGRERPERFDSNFQTFVRRLGGMADVVATLSRLLRNQSGTVVSSGFGEGIAEELSQFMEMLKMDRAEFLRFLTNQLQAGTRFGGALFQMLRNTYLSTDSEGLQNDILQFLKRYSDNSSTKHIEGNLLRNLNQMARAIPARFGNQLIEMLAKLENGISAGDRAGNLKLLQGEILPFMSDYVGRTHDLGRARDLLSLVTLDIARYESGSEQTLLQAFQLLKANPALRDSLGALDDQALLLILKNNLFMKAAEDNVFATQLAQLTHRTMSGGGGPEMQEAFRNLVSAFLVNESVYMNLNHHIIPLEWNGKFMFSELWVDPDAEERKGHSQEEATQRFLFKLDIQSLGFFDLVLTCRGESVDVYLRCPERLEGFSSLFGQNLSRILTENGFEARSVQVKKMDRPLTISQVFPKLFEGKDSVNVKI